MSTIIGHKHQIDYLNRVLERGTLGHAYLFGGPEHLGKMAVAKWMAEQLKALEVTVVSLGETLVSKKEKRKEIPIEDIRELKRRMAFRAAGDKWRIAIIDEAEKMSEEASNAFLKLLEEPGSQTLFILISHHPDAMLPTIRSRAQTISFSSVSDAELEHFLDQRKVSAKDREDILTVAAGRPGILLRALEDESFFNDERKLAEEVRNILTASDLPAVFRLSERAASDIELRSRIVFHVIEELRLRMRAASADTVSQCAQKIKYALRVSALAETVNVNSRLALDALMLGVLNV